MTKPGCYLFNFQMITRRPFRHVVSSQNWREFDNSQQSSSYGFVLTSTVSGVRTRATGGRNVVIESFSDEELKHDIKPETLGLNFLMKLKPVTYQVKHNPGITYHGLGARATEKGFFMYHA